MRRIDSHRFMPVQIESSRLAACDVNFLYHFVTAKDIPPAYLQTIQAWSSVMDCSPTVGRRS